MELKGKVTLTEEASTLKYMLYQVLSRQKDTMSSMARVSEQLGLVVDLNPPQSLVEIHDISLADIVSETNRQAATILDMMDDIEGRLI